MGLNRHLWRECQPQQRCRIICDPADFITGLKHRPPPFERARTHQPKKED